MNNKEQIKKLRDNTELAMVSYGFFHLADKSYNHNDKDEKRLKEFRELKAKALGKEIDESIYPTYTDILDITYKYYLDDNDKPKDSWYHKHFLGGDFSPLQAQRFFQRYDLLKHCPNTNSGFSATLFYDKEKDKFIIGFRGTK